MGSAKAFAATLGPLATGFAVHFGLTLELSTLLGATIGAAATWLIPNMVTLRDGTTENVTTVAQRAL